MAATGGARQGEASSNSHAIAPPQHPGPSAHCEALGTALQQRECSVTGTGAQLPSSEGVASHAHGTGTSELNSSAVDDPGGASTTAGGDPQQNRREFLPPQTGSMEEPAKPGSESNTNSHSNSKDRADTSAISSAALSNYPTEGMVVDKKGEKYDLSDPFDRFHWMLTDGNDREQERQSGAPVGDAKGVGTEGHISGLQNSSSSKSSISNTDSSTHNNSGHQAGSNSSHQAGSNSRMDHGYTGDTQPRTHGQHALLEQNIVQNSPSVAPGGRNDAAPAQVCLCQPLLVAFCWSAAASHGKHVCRSLALQRSSSSSQWTVPYTTRHTVQYFLPSFWQVFLVKASCFSTKNGEIEQTALLFAFW